MTKTASSAGGLELSIAVPENNGKRTISLDKTFQVVLTNRTGKPLKIWEDSNSWGYAALRFEITEGAGGNVVVRKKERDWRKNMPTFWAIDDGERVTYDVSLGSDEWEGLPKGLSGATVTMRAILEILPDEQSKEFGVWTGKVASPAAEYILR